MHEIVVSSLQQNKGDLHLNKAAFLLPGAGENSGHGVSQKEQLNMRSQMFSQLEDYENLLDVKLALDMKITVHRKTLNNLKCCFINPLHRI